MPQAVCRRDHVVAKAFYRFADEVQRYRVVVSYKYFHEKAALWLNRRTRGEAPSAPGLCFYPLGGGSTT